MGATRYETDLVEEIRLPAGGSFVITDELGNELFRVTAAGDAVKVAGVTIDASTLALDGLTASADELNKLDGAGDVVASGTAAAHIADPANGATVDAQARTAIAAILDALEAFGIAEVA
jgi:hypothetical protein